MNLLVKVRAKTTLGFPSPKRREGIDKPSAISNLKSTTGNNLLNAKNKE
jgi:hypothetical protein